jgi:glycosyltransferase involved in cell wall biosynthesis
VVFVSETVRDEAIGFGLIPKERTSVIHNGVASGLWSEKDMQEADRLLGPFVGAPLLLHVGSTVPRKRIDVLLELFAGVRREMPEVKLVRAGGPFTEAQQQLARKLGIEESIVSLPFVDRGVLTAMYHRAALLLQPSEAEGFGLPLVEAMACGCPVLATDLPVLREVGGTAAVYCQAGNVSEWTQAALNMLRERASGSSRWRHLTEESIRNASRFSWKETTDRLVGLYEKVSRHSAS